MTAAAKPGRIVKGRTTPTLDAERLILRSLAEGDSKALLDQLSNPDFTAFFDTDPIRGEVEALRLLRHWAEEARRGNALHWGVEPKDGSAGLIGCCGLRRLERNRHAAIVSYGLLPEFWGRGLGREVLTLLLGHGFDAWHLRRIEAWTLPGNLPSERLLRQHGFRLEGVLRERAFARDRFHDIRMWSVLADEWQARPADR